MQRIGQHFGSFILRLHSHSASIAIAAARKMSGYTDVYVTDKLQKELEATHLDVVDVSDGCGAKFDCIIVSPKFDGKPLLERHRLVNGILAEELKTIHAFTMKTLTPAQWEKLKNKE